MKKKTIIFDFDGTIADTLDTVVDIYNKIAPRIRCKTIKYEDKTKIKSKKIQDFFKEHGVNFLKLIFLHLYIKNKLSDKITCIRPIVGIIPALKEIKKAGFNLGIITSNSEKNVNNFLKNNEIFDIFNFIYSGRNIFGKDKVIKQLLKKKSLSKNSIIYVGDETRDIEMAKKIGIPIIAVSRGFNTKEILGALDPDEIIDNPKYLLECLKKM